MRGIRTRRVITLTAAILALSAAVAVAVTPKSGSWAGGTSSDTRIEVSFTVSKGDGKTKVSVFTLHHFGFGCNNGGGGGFIALPTNATSRVRDGAFSFDKTAHQQRVQVAGTFTSKTKAKGTVKLTEFEDDGAVCTTGRRDWVAKKVPNEIR